MANNPLNTEFVDKAIRFAVEAHSGTERRGKGFPYVIHVLEAMSITATLSPDPELLAAAALHDTVEDTDVTIEQIRAEFGDRVAGLVAAETDTVPAGADETGSWRARKQAAIDRISKASRDAKMVAMGDKLSNLRAIVSDYNKIGDQLWSRFHAPGGIKDHEWHYRGLADSLSDLSGTDAFNEFNSLIEQVFNRPSRKLLDMNEYEESGAGFTAVSYNCKDGKSMIKLYEDFIPSTQAEREYQVNRDLLDMGISIPEALGLVTDGKRIGVEFERIRDKRSIARAISKEPEKLEEYTRLFARMCRELHATPCNTRLFQPVEYKFLKVVNDSTKYTDAQKQKMTDFIHSIPQIRTCIHGDLHIGNALMSGDKTYWIDLADFAWGNPLYDLGMMYLVCVVTDDDAMTRSQYHISKEQIRSIWPIFVDEYFGHGTDPDVIGEQIAPFTALYLVDLEEKAGLLPGMKEFIIEKLIER